MKLKRLVIDRLPGISQRFEIEAARAGFHVVFGPNGIGKSSIGRAVEALYWEDRHPSPLLSVTGEFERAGASWWARRDGMRVTWQRSGAGGAAPGLPPSHHDRCFFLRLRDLIEPSRDGAADIAAAIRRQMAGGFDLDAVASGLFSGVTRHEERRGRERFNKAADAVAEAEGRQRGLQRRADELGRLKDQLARSEAAVRRRALVERAVGLVRRRQERARVMEQMAALPAPLARLTGREVEEAGRLRTQMDTLTERVQSLERDLRQARAVREETALDRPIERAELAVWLRKADHLRGVERDLGTARSAREGARRQLAAASRAAGGADVDGVRLTLPQHEDLFDFLRSSQTHAARVRAIREKLRLIERIDGPQDAEPRLAAYHEAADALRSWLRAPVPESPVRRVRNRWPWFVFALALAALGLAAATGPAADLIDAFSDGPAPGTPSGQGLLAGLLLGLAGGVALSALLAGGARGAHAARRAAQEAFGTTAVGGPDEWTLPSVAARLGQLERQAAAAEAARQRARDRGVERQGLENELDGLSEQEAALAARREELRGRLGVDPAPRDADLVDFARALDQLRQARAGDEAAGGMVEGLERQHAALLAELTGVLERHGEPAPGDADTAGARLHGLAERNTRLEQALSDERRAAGQLEEAAADREAAVHAMRCIYAEASLDEGDFDGLVSLCDALPHYRDLAREQTSLDGQIALDRAALEQAGESALAACGEPALQRIGDELAREESRAGGLRAEVAEVTAEVNVARSGNRMEERLAGREAARAGLRDLRDRALYAMAGRFLIRTVEEEHEHNRLPRVFERARGHFSEFTHHNYRLELDNGGAAPRLFAREARSGEARRLDELSDGTRAQLLLAARIAYAEEVEQGEVLPLFLDEALDQSDPQRFEAIVRGLGRLAREQDRQVFYLTSDPLDVDRIRDALGKEDCRIAAAIDLGRIRARRASVRGPAALRVEPGPQVPEPDGLSPEEYGAALAVPEFRPDRGHVAQHFYYVLWDDLNLLRDFLLHGVEWAGQWRTVRGTPLADRLGSRSIMPAEVTSRLALLEVFCGLWMQGRNRPVDRGVLEASGALTDRYREEVAAIARELDGDPAGLLDALAARTDPRLRGFHQANVDRLRHHLVEAGCLDERNPLTEAELVLRARITPAAAALPGCVAGDCLRLWWGWASRAPEPGPR